MKPSLGRIVMVRTLSSYNGSRVQPAVINRVWETSDPASTPGAYVGINVTVLPDCSAPFCMTSVSLFETQAEAYASEFAQVAWWPERG